ncbi:MAG: flavocytochrome c [Oscillospiraceae bacterium]|nr:flavocytochrome c [Oscillospiraceae bacterium]
MKITGDFSSYGMPDVWDETVDVIIVGSGFAGLAAAAEAGAKGAKVAVLEKMPYFGGNSRIAGGGCCSWDSKLKLREKLDLGEDSPQLHTEDTLKGGAYYNDPLLVEIMVRGAPGGLDWLMDAGIEFDAVLHHLGAHSAARGHHEINRSGKAMVEALYRQAEKCGADILLNSEVTRIWREDATGPVLGLRYNRNNTEKNLRSLKGIVIASGGFAADAEMVLQNNPGLGKDYLCSNHKGATGEMLRYAKAIGADTLHMEFIQLFPCAAAKSGALDRFALDSYSGAGFGAVYVNEKGLRFVNELAGRDEVSNAQLRHQSKPTWAIFSKDTFDALKTPSEILKQGEASKRLTVGKTPEETAKRAGIEPLALAATVNEHNAMIKNRSKDSFGKPVTAQMRLMENGPFYAVAQWPSVHFCMGGLRINKDAQVLDIWGNRIPKLYAAGEACGGVHGANRLAGNAITECIVFGRIAGVNVTGTED